MSDLERARLIPVAGNSDTPDLNNAVDVQFNPVTLKVNLANTLKANPTSSNTRATQFVDKSSSSLTVELVFDTTWIEAAAGGAPGAIEQGSDVRVQTRKIADAFLKPVEAGGKMQAPSRVLFQWGSFEFVGMVQSYDETLDFFSPKGRPLRATVALKLSEDRYQFRSNDSAEQDMEQTPTLAFTGGGAEGGGSGAGNGAPAPNQSASPVPGTSDGPGSWRENALFNGVESPRLPAMASLALPQVGLAASVGASFSATFNAGFSAAASAGVNNSAGISSSGGINTSAGMNTSGAGGAGNSTSGAITSGAITSGAINSGANNRTPGAAAGTVASTSPGFRFGNSAALGTRIAGAFSPAAAAGLTAASLQTGARQLRAPAPAAAPGVAATPGERQRYHRALSQWRRDSDSVGFD
jgi:hypothetical protein